MNVVLNRRYFIVSLLLHLATVLLFTFLGTDKPSNKMLVVYSAHSNNISRSVYKKRPFIVPFSSPGSKGSGKRPGKTNKRSKQKKIVTPKKTTASVKKSALIKKSTKQLATKSKKKSAVASKNSEPAAQVGTAFVNETQQLKSTKKQLRKKNSTPKKEDLQQVVPQKIEPVEEKQPEPTEEAPVHEELVPTPPVAEATEQQKDFFEKVDEIIAEEEIVDDEGDEADETLDLSMPLNIDSDPARRRLLKEISLVWHPPVVPHDTSALVRLVFDEQGNVSSCTFVKKSNILIYDMSITRYMQNHTFSPDSYKRTILLNFKEPQSHKVV